MEFWKVDHMSLYAELAYVFSCRGIKHTGVCLLKGTVPLTWRDSCGRDGLLFDV